MELFIGNEHQFSEFLTVFIEKNCDYSERVFIITDENVKKNCLPIVQKVLSHIQPIVITIKQGEENKDISQCVDLWQQLINNQCNRKSFVLIIGGGIVCDLCGFAISTFKRGVRYALLPTTLLAQTDAAIGGKNGINLGNIKNQIGLFSTPEAVIINTGFLKTLDKRQLQSGLMEVVKHGLISDPDILTQIHETTSKNDNVIDYRIITSTLLRSSINVKTNIVAQDFEENSIRKTLNFGHTIGHAIETIYMPNILHGEAIAFGMISALFLSKVYCNLDDTTISTTITYIISKIQMPTILQEDIEDIVKCIIHDKKNTNHAINFVLLKGIAKPVFDVAVEESEIRKAILRTINVLSMYE